MNYSGKWALVTGASAGIGAAFVRALAKQGANVVLVARRRDRLDALAKAIESDCNIKTIAYAADLADPGAPSEIAAGLRGAKVNVDVLINNAGFGLPGFYLESDWRAHRDFVELMVTSYAHMSHAFLPGMIERGYGRIIQVASVAGLVPGSAGHTLYGASKAFLVSFAQSLHAEYGERGVNTTALCPGFTYSEFHDVNSTRDLVAQLPKYMFMRAEPVVDGAINAVENGHVVFVPGLWNKFVVWLTGALPRPWSAAMVRRQSKTFRREKAPA